MGGRRRGAGAVVALLAAASPLAGAQPASADLVDPPGTCQVVATWTSGGVFIRVPSTQRHRPYVVYASNQTDTIHMLYTEAHPRDFDNSLYHVYYRGGMLHRSDGTPIRSLGFFETRGRYLAGLWC